MSTDMQTSITSNRTVMATAVAVFLLALVAVFFFYDPFHITSSAPEARDQGFGAMSLWLWFIGVVVLGGVIGYGLVQNRKRNPRDVANSDAGTRRVYMREDKDAGDGSANVDQWRSSARR